MCFGEKQLGAIAPWRDQFLSGFMGSQFDV